MEGKKIFQVYTEWGEIFDALDNEQSGKLIKHVFDYVRDKDPVMKDAVLKIAFISLKQDLKRDLAKWKKRQEASRANGRLGGRPTKLEKAIGSEETYDNLNNLTLNLKPDKVNVNVKDKVITDKVIKEDFELFLNEGFKYLGKEYVHGNPNTHRIESDMRRWLVTQDAKEQANNLKAYVKVTEKKFRVRSLAKLFEKLEEFNFAEEVKYNTNRAGVAPTKTAAETKADLEEEAKLRETYRKIREEADEKFRAK